MNSFFLSIVLMFLYGILTVASFGICLYIIFKEECDVILKRYSWKYFKRLINFRFRGYYQCKRYIDSNFNP